MKKEEVIIGRTISVFLLIATIITHIFIFKLNDALAFSLGIFSVLLFTLCTIGDKKERYRKKIKLIGSISYANRETIIPNLSEGQMLSAKKTSASKRQYLILMSP